MVATVPEGLIVQGCWWWEVTTGVPSWQTNLGASSVLPIDDMSRTRLEQSGQCVEMFNDEVLPELDLHPGEELCRKASVCLSAALLNKDFRTGLERGQGEVVG